ncbi:adenylate/guanylate cyclase domain-containing protein [Winogradskyella sp. 3972H.M.0a.05]|uniref:adenylate/guanylate cyclase domain-containing protein n=1 Tax=Winogradskyella sp. 3972H.M.0a.05 TaxID=2950277 RepID=UPI0033991BA2
MRQVRHLFIIILQSVVFWVFAFCFFTVIRYYALGEEEGVVVEPAFDLPIAEWLHFGLIVGVLVGFFFGIIEFLYDQFFSKLLPLLLSFLVKSFVYLVLLVASTTILITIAEEQLDRDLPNDDGWWMDSNIFLLVVAYFWVSSIVFFLIKFTYERYDYNIFLNIFFGRYRSPKEEERIFMFLDLNDSTTIAEELGHFKYSQLIRDFFNDLNKVMEPYRASIYQYVGDEAVITWRYKHGLKNSDCVNLFFKFRDLIEKRQDHYMKKYNLVPGFKAGLHGGKVMVTEVGHSSVKKELAYHGDVINSTSRILSLCKSLSASLLISSELWSQLPITYIYEATEKDPILLKGKSELTKTYALDLK